ncbi:MAG: substrate-binding domain-containing protein [Caldilineales bacterium]
MTFTGSLGGLIALARGEADLAGSHLLDVDTGSYNEAYVRRLLPGQRVALLTVAHRRLGLMVRPDRAAGGWAAQPGRGWAALRQSPAGIGHARLAGCKAGRAGDRPGQDRRLRLHLRHPHRRCPGRGGRAEPMPASASRQPRWPSGCTSSIWRERYDLVIPEACWGSGGVQAMAQWLSSDSGRRTVRALGGYDTNETGALRWVG